RRPLPATRFLRVPLPAFGPRPAPGRAHGAPRVRRPLSPGRDPALAVDLPAPLLREPVQARLRPRLPQGRLRRLPLPPRRLAHAERRERRRLDRRGRDDPRVGVSRGPAVLPDLPDAGLRHPPRKTIRPCVGSYGDTAMVTRSPGITRMW